MRTAIALAAATPLVLNATCWFSCECASLCPAWGVAACVSISIATGAAIYVGASIARVLYDLAQQRPLPFRTEGFD